MNVGRVVTLFAYCFGIFIVPAAIVLPLVFLFMPAPYLVKTDAAAVVGGLFVDTAALFGTAPTAVDADLRADFAGAGAAARASFDDGSRVTVLSYATAGDAGAAMEAVVDPIPRSSTLKTPGKIQFTRRDDGSRGLVMSIGRLMFLTETPADGDPAERLMSLPSVVENPEKSPLFVFIDEHPEWIFAIILVYIVIQVFIVPRIGSWAARVDRDPDGVGVDPLELRRRLMAVNDHGVPFEVKEGSRDDELVVEWKYADAHWVGLMAAGGVASLARIRLRIGNDRTRRVRAADATSSVTWGVGSGGPIAAGSLKWAAFKGIVFKQYEYGQAYGLLFKDGGLTFDEAYRYAFSFSEMKNPVIEIVTRSGWDYVPVITFNRLFNG